MKKSSKVDNLLQALWIIFLPLTIAQNLLLVLLVEFDIIDIKINAVVWANIMGLLLTFYFIGWLINLLIMIILCFCKKEKI